MIDFHCDNCEFLQDKSNDNIIDGYCKKYNQSLTFYDWFEKCDKCLIETLQSENAALRERLEKAVNKRVVANMLAKYFDCPCNFSPIDEEMYEFCDSCAMNDVDCWEKVIEKNIAEARLAELKGEKNE